MGRSIPARSARSSCLRPDLAKTCPLRGGARATAPVPRQKFFLGGSRDGRNGLPAGEDPSKFSPARLAFRLHLPRARPTHLLRVPPTLPSSEQASAPQLPCFPHGWTSKTCSFHKRQREVRLI